MTGPFPERSPSERDGNGLVRSQPTFTGVKIMQTAAEDIIINDRGDAYYCGDLITQRDEDGNPDFEAIREWCDTEQYWPNVWEVNDHGNASLYSIWGECLGGLV